MSFYCNVLKIKAPSVRLMNERVLDANIIPTIPNPNGIVIQEVLELQSEYSQTILSHGKHINLIPSTLFTTAAINGSPSWTLFTIDVTNLIMTYGTGLIMDFSFTKSNLGSDNAYIRNVVLNHNTDNGEVSTVFDYSNAKFNPLCSIYTHPTSSSGQEVHTYQYIPKIYDNITSSSISFELADDWICSSCCGNSESGTSINIIIGFEILPVV